MEIAELKAEISGYIDAHYPQLSEISLKIHSNPELGYHEVKAAGWLTQYLEEQGFSIKRGICNMSTAFKARYGKGKPVIALLAEYDALPDIGHACGHNLIATCTLGAGIASKPAIDQFGGSILVIGTPAEEVPGGGGKAIMANVGAFNGIDAAMIVHPGTQDIATMQALACIGLEVEFIGKAAHAASRPEAGINALEAMLQSFTAINSLRQHIRSSARIHGIITDGGEAPNIVPAHSSGIFMVRADDIVYLEELKQKVLHCFIAASTATGAELKYKWDEVLYAPMRNNIPLAELYIQNMKSLGRSVVLTDPDINYGSTDMGNVSQVVPSIHPHVQITEDDISIHSTEFALAAASEAGTRAMLDAAKAVAMTVVDLLASPEILVKVKKEFVNPEKE